MYARDIDIFHDFTNEIDQYSTQGSVAIIGDLNARIGVKNKSRITLNIDQDIPVPGLVSKSELPSRNSEDRTVNSRGRKLLNLMTNHDLLLANGRICGDLRGKHTCCQWNGSSVVDMFLAQCDLIPRINYFRVGQFDWMSDHAFISTDVAVDIAKYKDIPSEWKRVNRQMQNWDTESKEKIREILDSPSFKTKLDNFCNMHYVSSSEAAAELTFIIQDTVKRVFPRKIKHHKSRKLKSGAAYSHEVKVAKRIFKQEQSETA